MSDWTDGYHAALGDLERLAESRFASSFPTRFRKAVAELVSDLRSDASVIDHEQLNRDQRIELEAERESVPARQGSLL